MVKKVTSLFLCIVLCMAMVIPAFAAEVVNDTQVPETASNEGVAPRVVSGYGQVTNVSNNSGTFRVPVTATQGANGYGLTVKTTGNAVVTVEVYKPNGDRLVLGNNFSRYEWTLEGIDEKQKNFNGIMSGDYIVKYTVMGGPAGIYCHIYG